MAFLSQNEYALELQERLMALKARVRQAGPIPSGNRRKDILYYFMGRAIQIGECCFRSQDFEVPVFILGRILCDDMFTMYWVSLSEENALEFEKIARSEKFRYMRRNLLNKRAVVRSKATGENATAQLINEASIYIGAKRTIESIAQKCQLSDIYDILIGYNSLYVHANAYDLNPATMGIEPKAAALSMIASLTRVTALVWDREYGTLTAEEIRAHLNIQWDD
jgi:hypothetical protein